MQPVVRDQNYVPVLMGVSSSDGITPVPIQIDPVSGRVLVNITIIASETPTVVTRIPRDNNFVPVLAGASTSDGITVLPIHISASTGGVSTNYVTG